jgi:AcrR family transcriptional regulator
MLRRNSIFRIRFQNMGTLMSTELPAKVEQPIISKAKRQIMERAAHLFAERGYGSVGISEVGEVAGLGKGALYYHIGSKEDLLYAIMTDYMMQLNAAGFLILDRVKDTRKRIVKLSESFMETMFRSRAEMTVCFREVHSLGFEKREGVLGLHGEYQRIWEKTFADGAAAGDCRRVPKIECKALLGMYFYSFLWVRTDGQANSSEIAAQFAGIVLRDVMNGKK